MMKGRPSPRAVFRFPLRGFSMLEVLVASAILGIGIIGLMRLSAQSGKSMAQLEDRQELAALGHYLLGFTDCSKTEADAGYSNACLTDSAVNILDKTGSTVIPAAGKDFGAYTVKARCNAGALRFTATKTLPGGAVENRPLLGSIPIQCGNTGCEWQAPYTRRNVNGFLEFVNESRKPGIYGTPTAKAGTTWADGGSNKPWGEAPNTLDWRLCNKIGFVETGHSLTRTISFISPASSGTYQLTIHRARFALTSPGVGIWYHWGTNVSWVGPSLHNSNNRRDYNVTCNYNKTTDSFSCSWTSTTLTTNNCALYQNPCTTFSVVP